MVLGLPIEGPALALCYCKGGSQDSQLRSRLGMPVTRGQPDSRLETQVSPWMPRAQAKEGRPDSSQHRRLTSLLPGVQVTRDQPEMGSRYDGEMAELQVLNTLQSLHQHAQWLPHSRTTVWSRRAVGEAKDARLRSRSGVQVKRDWPDGHQDMAAVMEVEVILTPKNNKKWCNATK